MEKSTLRNLIKDGFCNSEEEECELEENFKEAIHYVNTCIGQLKIPTHVQNILDDERSTNLTQEVCQY